MRAPPTAFLVLSTRCDQGCGFCYYQLDPQREHARSLAGAQLLRSLDQLAERGLQAVFLTGGEPLQHPDLDAIVAHTTALGLSAILLTSGAGMDTDRALALEEAGLQALVLSLSAFGPEQRRRFAVAATLRSARPSLTFVITAANAAAVPLVRATARSAELPLLLQLAWIPDDHPAAQLDPRQLPARKGAALTRELQAWSTEVGLQGYRALQTAWLEGRPTRPSWCELGGQALVLDADGSVLPCFHRRDLACGNVESDQWDGILERLSALVPTLWTAPCYGGHCLSLHLEQRSLEEPDLSKNV